VNSAWLSLLEWAYWRSEYLKKLRAAKTGTARCTSLVSVWQCKLVSVWKLRKRRSAPSSTWTGDCLRTGKPSLILLYNQHQSQRSLRPSGIDTRKWVPTPACLAGVMAVRVHLCRVAGDPLCDPLRQMTLGISEVGFLWTAIPLNHL